MDNTDRLRSFSSPTGPRPSVAVTSPSPSSTSSSSSSSSNAAAVRHAGATKSGLYAVEISPALLAKSPPKTPAPPPPTTPTTPVSSLSLSIASTRTPGTGSRSGLATRSSVASPFRTPPPTTPTTTSTTSTTRSITSPSSTMVQQVAKPRQINQDRMEDASIGNSPMYSNLHEVMLRHTIGASANANSSLHMRDADLSLDDEDPDLSASLLSLSSDSETPDPYALATERLMATIERVEALQQHSIERNLLMMQLREQKHRSATFLEAVRTGDLPAVRRSITYGVDVNLKDQFSVSALHHAASSNMVELGTVLLDHGADINSRDSNHWTPLHAASIAGHLEMCMLLLNRGADVSAQSQDGNLPLHYLARCPSLASQQPELYLRVLLGMLQMGANINHQNRQGETALHEASFRGTVDCVRFFIKYSTADVNMRTSTGETPLHYAVRAGNRPVVQLLLDMGADQDIAGLQGTAQQVAVREGHAHLIEHLSAPRPKNRRMSVPIHNELRGNLEQLVRDVPLGTSLADRSWDRYGFLIDNDLVLEHDAIAKKMRPVLEERQRVWVKYIGSSDLEAEIKQFSTSLRKMVRKGIPHQYRGDLWFKFAVAKKGPLNTEYYRDLTTKTSPVADEIEKDIHRTFPGHQYFMSESGRQALRDVLRAYSLRNPALGYCQSMNFLVGLLLLVMPEERAFWVLCFIVEDLLQDYFVRSMRGLTVDQRVLEYMLEKKLPKVHKQALDLGFPLSIITTRWHMCVFLNSLPTESVLRVWDCFLLEGGEFVLVVSFWLIKMNETPISNAQSMAELMSLFSTVPRRLFDSDRLIKGAVKYATLFEDKQEISSLRVDFWTQIELEAANKRRELMMLQRDRSFFPATEPVTPNARSTLTSSTDATRPTTETEQPTDTFASTDSTTNEHAMSSLSSDSLSTPALSLSSSSIDSSPPASTTVVITTTTTTSAPQLPTDRAPPPPHLQHNV